MSSSFLTNFFKDYFPPPKFLEMSAVGLDISDECIRFAELHRVGDHFELGKWGEKKIPKDIIEEGFIKDKPRFIRLLAELRQEHGLRYVKVSLPEEKSYLFKTEVPLMDDSDIKSALQFKIEENVPIALGSAVYDYAIIRRPTSPDGRIELGVSVVHTTMVFNYLSCLEEAGLTVLELCTESWAILQASMIQGNRNALMLVSFRETKTVLLIVSQGVIQFTSTLPIGGNDVVEAVAQMKNKSVDPKAIKEVRDSHALFSTLTSAFSTLHEEIQKLLTYWDSHGDGQKINEIIISGSGALSDLDVFLSEACALPVQRADVWKNIASLDQYIPDMTHELSHEYVSALGLALPHD